MNYGGQPPYGQQGPPGAPPSAGQQQPGGPLGPQRAMMMNPNAMGGGGGQPPRGYQMAPGMQMMNMGQQGMMSGYPQGGGPGGQPGAGGPPPPQQGYYMPPGQQASQGGPPQQMPPQQAGAAQRSSQQQLESYLRRLPLEVQTQIRSLPPDQQVVALRRAVHQQQQQAQMRMMQQQQQQGGMPQRMPGPPGAQTGMPYPGGQMMPGGYMVGPPQGPPTGAPPQGVHPQMPPGASMHPGMTPQAAAQMSMQNRLNVMPTGYPAGATAPGPGGAQLARSPMTQSQQPAASPQSSTDRPSLQVAMSNSPSAAVYPSPGSVGILNSQGGPDSQRATAFAAGGPVTPASRPDGAAPGSVEKPAAVSSEEQEYDNLLKEMAEKNLSSLQRIVERHRIDGKEPPSTVERLIEILERRRVVKLDLLRKLNSSVSNLIERHSITYPLIEALKSVAEDFNAHRANFPDPWKDLRSMMIRVPDHVANLYKTSPEGSPKVVKTEEEGDEAEEGASSKKRSRDENSPPSKRIKLEERVKEENGEEEEEEKELDEKGEDEERDEIHLMNVEPSPTMSVGDEEEERISFKCLFDRRHEVRLTAEASSELRRLPWRVEPDHAPSSRESPDVIVTFSYEALLQVPLRVLLPLSYPAEGAHVLYEESFPRSCPRASELFTLFDRRLSLCSNRYSLTNIFNAWKQAGDQWLAIHQAAAQVETRGHLYRNQVLF